MVLGVLSHDYQSASYFAIAFFTDAGRIALCSYAEDIFHYYGGELSIEALLYSGQLDIAKLRKRKFSPRKVDDFLSVAIEKNVNEIGIYISSPDYSRTNPPSFLCNLHFSLSGTVAGRRLADNPTAFFICGIRSDVESLEEVKRFAVSGRPSILKGGHWNSRLYEDHGASLEWAYRNYTSRELVDWSPNFDQEYA